MAIADLAALHNVGNATRARYTPFDKLDGSGSGPPCTRAYSRYWNVYGSLNPFLYGSLQNQ